MGIKKSKVWGDESRAVDLALSWAKEHTVSGGDPKTTFRPAEELYQEVGETITPEGLGADEAIRIYNDILKPATRSSDDPMMLSFIPGAPTRSAVAFDTAVSAANVFGGMWEMGAGAIFAENQVIDWIKSLLKWPASAKGTFVSGGTLGNLAALATARHTAQEEWNALGRFQNGRPLTGFKLACASTAHSSVRAVATVLDVEVVTVPVDERGHLTGDAVAHALDENPGVFAVVCSTGTTNSGIIDDVADIVKAAHERGVWVHADGAYGGAGLAAPSVRGKYRGIEEADSFIVDPHKWLFAPYDCCAVLYRKPEYARRTFSQHAEYLDLTQSSVDPSDFALHLSRRTRGLPLWYSLVTHGTKKYTEAIELALGYARKTADYIKKSDHLELIMEPELSVVVFRRKGWTDRQYKEWSNRLAKAGDLLCIPTKHDGETVLRLAFVNPDTDVDQVIHLLDTTMK